MERKLKPIYDSLDARNYKQALKLSDNYLKKEIAKGNKSSNVQLVMALKALALDRLGRTQESSELCLELKNLQPLEEIVLNTLSLVYKSLGQLDQATECYENAVKKKPDSEELVLGVFESYIRRGDYQKQNQTAMKLFRLTSNQKYLMWAIMSLVLQVKNKQGNVKLLDLAEKLMEKLRKDERINHVENLSLYFIVLEQQEKYEQIVEILDSPLGELYKVKEEKLRYKGELLTRLSKWKEANEVYADLLTNYNWENWLYFCGYLDSGFQLKDENSREFAKKALSLVESLHEKETPKMKRECLLAKIEIELRSTADLKVVKELLVEYFQKFSQLPSCYADMSPYLNHMKNQANDFCSELYSFLKSKESEEDEKSNNIYRFSSYHQICRYLGLHQQLSKSKLVELANEYIKFHTETTKDLVKEITESAPSDPVLIEASHILRQFSFKEDDIQSIVEAILVLNHGLSISPHNFHIKIALLQFYSKIGAVYPAYELCISMDFKHILLDTLSYLILDDLICLGMDEGVSFYCDEILQFHDINTKQTPDEIIRAYSYGSFSRINEFIEFKTKLEDSHQLAITNTENILLSLKNCNTLQELEKLLKSSQFHRVERIASDDVLSSLRMNQDYSIILSWDPEEKNHKSKPLLTSANTFGHTKDEQLQTLKARSLIPLLLLDIHEKDNEKLDGHLKELQSSLESLNFFDQKFCEKESSFEIASWTLIHQMFFTSSCLSKMKMEDPDPQQAEQTKNSFEILAKMLSVIAEKYLKNLNPLTLYHFTYFTGNTLNLITLLFQFWHQRVPSSKKKNPGSSFTTELRSQLKSVLTLLKNSIFPQIQQVIQDKLTIPFEFDKVNINLLKEEEKRQKMEQVLQKINFSYGKSLASLQEIVDQKSKVISAYKL